MYLCGEINSIVTFYCYLKTIPMKKFTLGLVALLILITANLELVAQQALVPFDKIVLTGNISALLVEGEHGGISIQNNEDNLEYGVEGKTLKIESKNLIKYKKVPTIKVIITYNKLRGIKARAGASVFSDNILEAAALNLRFSSGASGELTIDTEALEVGVSEGSHLTLSGTADFQEVKSVTGGSIVAYQLDSKEAIIKTNTGGSAKLMVHESITASAKTGGNISYKGKPEKVKINNGLSGSIKGL